MAGRRTHRTRGIVLDHVKLGEQDLIVTLLTANGAQARAVAKGARKPGGRLAARVELFSETDFLLASGRNLDIVSEATLVDPHERLRGDLERVSAASASCEVARLTSFEDAEDSFVYPLLSRALRAFEEAVDQPHLDLTVAAYVFKVLAHEGWRPELDHCIACGDPSPMWFSSAAGGALCESCAREDPWCRAHLAVSACLDARAYRVHVRPAPCRGRHLRVRALACGVCPQVGGNAP